MNYNIILAAQTEVSMDSYSSLMRPIRGKPALGHVINHLTDLDKTVLMLNKDNTLLRNYFALRYPLITVIPVDPEKEMANYGQFTLLNTLHRALTALPPVCTELTVILGDTICRHLPHNLPSDLVIVSKEIVSSERWCLVQFDENKHITYFHDKVKNLDLTDKYAIVGYYRFGDVGLLSAITHRVVEDRLGLFSDVLAQYNKYRPLSCLETAHWIDLGHKAGLIKAQNDLYNSRDFNTLSADPIHGIISKTSTKIQKLADEYAWFNNIPVELKTLTPRIVSFEEKDNKATLVMEICGYPALSELFILGAFQQEEWELIIERVLAIHRLFCQYKGKIRVDELRHLYQEKTLARIQDLLEQSPDWEHLWNYDNIWINGQAYRNLSFFIEPLQMATEALLENFEATVVHGDYCFSNILCDSNSFICKLIDPRGRLSDRQTIYGDPRYDIAKLRHSIVGGYDFVVNGLYTLEQNNNEFKVSDNYHEFQDTLNEYFDKKVTQLGYDLEEIRLIEALLFLSMIPLHRDCQERQKVFYLKAVKKINEYFGRVP